MGNGNGLKILLIAKMRAGKDTVKDYLVDKYGMTPFAFGARLKDGFHNDYPHVPREPKPARGYQLYGQLRREVDGYDVWVDKCFETIDKVKEMAESYDILDDQADFIPVISDGRQPNEIERCRAEGFTTIRVNCPDETRVERMRANGEEVTVEQLQFETEASIDGYDVDYDIYNDSTLDELYAQIDEVIHEIRNIMVVE